MAGQPPFPPDPSGYSNYPRSPIGGYDPGYNPNQRAPGVYYDQIGTAWKLLQQNWGTWIVCLLVAGVANYALSIPFNVIGSLVVFGTPFPTSRQTSPGGMPSLTLLAVQSGFGIIPSICMQAVNVSLLYMGVRQARGETIEIADMIYGFKRFGSLALAGFFIQICTVLGLLCLIIPGFLVIGMFAFVPLLILDRNMTVQEAFVECINNIWNEGIQYFWVYARCGPCSCPWHDRLLRWSYCHCPDQYSGNRPCLQ